MLCVHDLMITRGTGDEQHQVLLPRLALGPGQVMAVTGESGCGKSTLLEALGLLLKPDQAGVFKLGAPAIDINRLLQQQNETRLAQIRARQLDFILENGGLLPYLNVLDNIQLPRRILGLPPHNERLDKAIKTLKINRLIKKMPQALSIGERQRVACLRAIAHEPQLLLADEPTAALDPYSARNLFELFLEVVNASQLSALVVSHDWALVKEFGLPVLHAHSKPGESTFLLAND